MPAQLELMRIVKGLVKRPASELSAELGLALDSISHLAGGSRAWLFHREASGLLALLRPAGGAARRLDWHGEGAEPPRLRSFSDHDALAEDSPERLLLDALGLVEVTVLECREGTRLRGLLCLDRAPQNPEVRAALPDLLELMLDILDRQSADSNTQDKDMRLVSTSHAMPELMLELDARGLSTGFYAGQLGLRAADIAPGEPPEAVLLAPLLPLIDAAFTTALAEGIVGPEQQRVQLSGGDRVLELRASRRGAADSPEATVLLVLRDITRNHLMREELLRLDSVMNAMSNIVVMVDTDLRIRWVNSAFERQTGWKLSEVRGEILANVVRCSDSDPDVIEGVARAVREVRPYSGEIVNADRHGNRYWVDFNVVPFRGHDGKLAGFVSVETVVTRLKEQERANVTMAQTAAAAQTRLVNAINALPNGTLIFDSQERLVMRNEGFDELYPQLSHVAVPGITLVDFLRAGARLGALLPAFAPGSFESWIRSELAIYRAERDERETERADGRWIHRVSNRTSDGGLIIIHSDITAKHMHRRAMDAAHQDLTRALEERDQARTRLLSIIEGAQVGTWEVDARAGMLSFSGHWADILGRDPAEGNEISLKDLGELVHPEDLASLLETYKTGPTENSLFERELRMRHSSGHWVWVLTRGRVTRRNRDRVPINLVGVNIDISQRKRLEQEVREREQHLTSALESSVAAIAMIDDKNQLIFTNMEADRILQLTSGRRGRRSGEPAHWSLENIDGGPLSPENDPIRLARESGATVRDVLVSVQWQDGTRRVLTCNASPLDLGDGTQNIVTSFWDITDQLAATERLEQALAHAEEMSQAKTVFLANMSHEIRTPLNGVLGMTEVLGMQLTDPDHRRMIDTIRESGQTLLTVLNSILDMSKIEAGKMELEDVPFLLQEAVGQVDAVYTVQAEEKGIEFEVMISSDGDVPRIGDPHRIQQILHNLLSNAIKFTASGLVTLQVSCRRGKPVVFKVSDTGPGMTPEQSERVFESFEQADGSTTRRYGGTGLGLSIVRQLVTLMGGKIRLDTRLGRGTTISIELPLPEGRMPEPRAGLRPDHEDNDLGPLRILSADDNPTNREVMGQMLAQTGVILQQAENGRQAVDFWQAARAVGLPFDLVLLDVTMPELDGPSAVAEIRAIEQAQKLDPVAVVAVTANAMPDQLSAYLARGFDSHLAKPFARRDLLRVIRDQARPHPDNLKM